MELNLTRGSAEDDVRRGYCIELEGSYGHNSEVLIVVILLKGSHEVTNVSHRVSFINSIFDDLVDVCLKTTASGNDKVLTSL